MQSLRDEPGVSVSGHVIAIDVSPFILEEDSVRIDADFDLLMPADSFNLHTILTEPEQNQTVSFWPFRSK